MEQQTKWALNDWQTMKFNITNGLCFFLLLVLMHDASIICIVRDIHFFHWSRSSKYFLSLFLQHFHDFSALWTCALVQRWWFVYIRFFSLFLSSSLFMLCAVHDVNVRSFPSDSHVYYRMKCECFHFISEYKLNK